MDGRGKEREREANEWAAPSGGFKKWVLLGDGLFGRLSRALLLATNRQPIDG